MALTLIAGIKCWHGVVLAADTEVVIPDVLRTQGEKIRTLGDGTSDWRILLAGAGNTDHIGMVGDFIQERVAASPATAEDIVTAIRSSVHDVWSDYFHYEQERVTLSLLLGIWSNDHILRLMVVSQTSVRDANDLETFGIGAATFNSLADRFLPHGRLSAVGGSLEAVRLFTILAMQQAKLSVPGVGGSSRIVTLGYDGSVRWEKAAKVVAVQQFFSQFDSNVRFTIANLSGNASTSAENMWKQFSGLTRKDIKDLKKHLDRIERDATLL